MTNPIGERVARLEANNENFMKQLLEIKNLQIENNENLKSHTENEEHKFGEIIDSINSWKLESDKIYLKKVDAENFLTKEEFDMKTNYYKKIADYIIQGVVLLTMYILAQVITHTTGIKFF